MKISITIRWAFQIGPNYLFPWHVYPNSQSLGRLEFFLLKKEEKKSAAYLFYILVSYNPLIEMNELTFWLMCVLKKNWLKKKNWYVIANRNLFMRQQADEMVFYSHWYCLKHEIGEFLNWKLNNWVLDFFFFCIEVESRLSVYLFASKIRCYFLFNRNSKRDREKQKKNGTSKKKTKSYYNIFQ